MDEKQIARRGTKEMEKGGRRDGRRRSSRKKYERLERRKGKSDTCGRG